MNQGSTLRASTYLRMRPKSWTAAGPDVVSLSDMDVSRMRVLIWNGGCSLYWGPLFLLRSYDIVGRILEVKLSGPGRKICQLPGNLSFPAYVKERTSVVKLDGLQ